MKKCCQKKFSFILQNKYWGLIVLLITAGLLCMQQARAYSSQQEKNIILSELLLPEQESYLLYNPFTLSEIEPSVSSPDQMFGEEGMTMLFASSGLYCPIIKRPPVRCPVRPPLRSPYIPLP